MLNKVDLIQELSEAQERAVTDSLLLEAHDILFQEAKRDDSLRDRLSNAAGKLFIDEKRLDPARIFDLSVIRTVAIRYRLRFLDTKYYKNEFPREALSEIKALENGLNHDITDFKILAPAMAFDLCDADADPLLFVPVGKGRYYLIHKWGNDLNKFRRLAYWPLRSPRNLAAVLIALAMFFSSLVPTELLTSNPNAGFFGIHRVMFFIWTSVVIASFTTYAWWAFFGKFSTKAWNDHRFN